MSYGDGARQYETAIVLGGHAPLPANVKPAAQAPVKYEEAIKALESVQTIDEARYFDDQAEALAAWAKIYTDDRAANTARRLKLHAYRRIGILAEQLRPKGSSDAAPRVHGQWKKGGRSVLIEAGFKPNQAVAALAVAKLPEPEFRKAVASERPPSPAIVLQVRVRKNPQSASLAIRFTGLLSFLRKADFPALVASMDEKDLAAAKARNREAMALIGKFQQAIQRGARP
jgi:hypothetical protein